MDSDIAAKSPYVTRFYIGIAEEAKAIKEYFASSKKAKRVGFLYAKVPAIESVVNNEYIPMLKDKNIEVPIIENYDIGEKDFKTTVLKIANANIDHLVILGYGFEYQNIFNELKQQKILGNIQIIGGWGFLYTSMSPSLIDGVIVSGPDYVFTNREMAKVFYDEYTKEFKTHPNFDAAFAYNVINAISKYFSKEELKSPIKDKFYKLGKLSGVVGNYYVNKRGEMIVNTGMGVIKDGIITEYKFNKK